MMSCSMIDLCTFNRKAFVSAWKLEENLLQTFILCHQPMKMQWIGQNAIFSLDRANLHQDVPNSDLHTYQDLKDSDLHIKVKNELLIKTHFRPICDPNSWMKKIKLSCIGGTSFHIHFQFYLQVQAQGPSPLPWNVREICPWKEYCGGALEALEPATSTQRTVRRWLPPTKRLKVFAKIGRDMENCLFDSLNT